ncbi:MAG: AAA domain-containing protein [Methylococcales bacterium]|jgi:hypothetical protein|nr:AAA domain-containing protein [Methylococcales bacterium]MBT7410674.1 AAA domain-containing protein [Methylococcales bacterium]
MNNTNDIDQGVAEDGAYEIIRKRLSELGKELENKARHINSLRLETFGSTQMEVIGRTRVRTENNCVPRDIVNVGQYLLFGYNVFIGLKTETNIADVFSLYGMKESEDGIELGELSNQESFLANAQFNKDFHELYNYYKQAKLIHLGASHNQLLMSFQIGKTLSDMKAFRWEQSTENEFNYLDNRGEHDLVKPPSHDFEWVKTRRENHVSGNHPHVNILDTIFVETINGYLTIKIENNTEDGLGVFREAVDDKHQSLSDAEISFAEIGRLILLQIKPYREDDFRYLVFNKSTQQAERIDGIGQGCVQLPEDHGIIFPGGYYLTTGETKQFDEEIHGLELERVIRAPNGEDVFYIFYEAEEGRYALFSYNMIRKELLSPIHCHGYSLFDDGRLVIFKAESDEPTRIHPMQIWQTPFMSDEFAGNVPQDNSLMGRIGNAELVRGISDFYSVTRSIVEQSPSLIIYEELIDTCKNIFDAYYWINEAEFNAIDQTLKSVAETAELVLDEFEKVESIRTQARKSLKSAEVEQLRLLDEVEHGSWNKAQQFVEGLKKLRARKGHLISLRELRYMDEDALSQLEQQIEQKNNEISASTVRFLQDDKALETYHQRLNSVDQQLEVVTKVSELEPLSEELNETGGGLELLTEMIGGLKIDDATIRTKILESISQVFSKLNRSKANAQLKHKELRSGEAVAEFAAQFQLFSQSVTNALGMTETPEKCDEQLSRLLVQLEELEANFSDFDEFLSDLMAKREEIYESFEARKQTLIDERNRRSHNLAGSAQRIVENINKRVQRFKDVDELNTYFATDSMIFKVQELIENLRDIQANVRADDIEAKFKASKDQALRAIRDKQDIFEDGGNTIKLGKHRFSVTTQELDLTLLQRDDSLQLHLTGTDFFSAIDDQRLTDARQYWNQNIVSETNDVYRGEFLAASILFDAENGDNDLSIQQLNNSLIEEANLMKMVKDYATPKYNEGYEKGVHDADAFLILKELLKMRETVGLLRYPPYERSLAVLFWCFSQHQHQLQQWHLRAVSLSQVQQTFGDSVRGNSQAKQDILAELSQAIQQFTQQSKLSCDQLQSEMSADYLLAEIQNQDILFTTNSIAMQWVDGLQKFQSMKNKTSHFEAVLTALNGDLSSQYQLVEAWLRGYSDHKKLEKSHHHFLAEAVTLILTAKKINRQTNSAHTFVSIDGLLGQHQQIKKRSLSCNIDEFLQRLRRYKNEGAAGYFQYLKLRKQILGEERDALRLHEFKPKPLTSFVRNKLINDVYLEMLGSNLAKQMGSSGDAKRTDLMGMLLLISPPGYGKTTLMEYTASRLGLIFMKINCPAIGHDVASIDPADAPNATAKQELEKLNLGLEMGNNVMLYLDDIQHTNPEFLQKFISLCDAQRRIEGVWRGQAKTYDLRGKKFCIIMAGNPYTESGDAFTIPDMLANRADIYNLGDMLSGSEEVFALSYIENCLTANTVLAPLATRNMDDVYLFVKMANGEEVATTDLSHDYSGAEVNEIKTVLQKITAIQQVVLKVNQQYIASAATDDRYRTEPPFKLQGSYRNMSKMAEKIVAVMNEAELQSLISDHYIGEAQTLTTGAEENLLKLGELRGTLTDDESTRWQQIKADYKRLKSLGGDDSDPVTKAANQLSFLIEHTQSISGSLQLAQQNQQGQNQSLDNLVVEMQGFNEKLSQAKLDVQVVNQPVPGIETILTQLSSTVENSLVPVLSAMNHKVRMDHDVWEKVKSMSETLLKLDKKSFAKTKVTRETKKLV